MRRDILPLNVVVQALGIWALWVFSVFLAILLLTAKASANDQVVPDGLSLVGVAEADGVAYASLVDNQSGERYLINTRTPENGLELAVITPSDDAIIRQNGQSFLLRLGWTTGAVAVAAPSVQAASLAQNIPRPGDPGAITLTPPKGAKLPLVFQDSNMKGLTSGQKATITRLRQEFLATVGGSGKQGDSVLGSTGNSAVAAAVPSTPGDSSSAVLSPAEQLLNQWNSAQDQSDAEFRMLFGTEAFNLYEMGLIPKPHL